MLFTIDELRRIKNKAVRRAHPVLVGDNADAVSTTGLLKHTGRPNAFSSGNLGVAVPLHGNGDEVIHIGQIG